MRFWIKFMFSCWSIVGIATVNPAVAQTDSLQIYLARGDSAYDAFDNQLALRNYRAALALDPGNYAALWRTARAYADLGESAKAKARKKAYFAEADSTSLRCLVLHPDSAESHFVRVMALGRRALFVGGKKKIALSKEIKREAEQTIALNPQHDGAYHTLGRWNYELATLNWFLRAAAKVIYGGVPKGASLEEAARMFEQAIKYAPKKILHRLEYGRTLMKLGRYAEARAQFEQCQKLQPMLWEDEAHKKEAARLWKKIRRKKDKR